MARKLLARAATVFAALAATTTLFTGTATAHLAPGTVSDNCDVPWINCSYGDLWLFYNSKSLAIKDGRIVSAYATFYGNVNDYWGTQSYNGGSTLVTYRYVFDSADSGHGQYVKNNAASVQNCASADNYRVYYNSGYGGTSQYFAAGGGWGCNHVDLISALKNNNASQHFA